MNEINYNPLFTAYINKNKGLLAEPFILLDVGAGGGIRREWDVFKPTLRAYGFDPLVNEVNRLNQINDNPLVQYLAYFVVSENPEIDDYRPTFLFQPIGRSSALLHHRQQKINYLKKILNSDQPVVMTDKSISLDRFCREEQLPYVNFIKIDTDGHDFKVLSGSKKILADPQTLGLFVECEHTVELHPYANAFRNVDTLLVSHGFDLFDLPITRYTRKELPGKFFYTIPAQTVSGQSCSGDALYLKDFVKMKKRGLATPPVISLIKMACLQEIYGLPDCAAELLTTFEAELKSVIDIEHSLDLLAKDMGFFSTYREHTSQFSEHPEKFFPAVQPKGLFEKIGIRLDRLLKGL